MIEIIKHKKIDKIKDVWEKMYAENSQLPPTMKYDFVKVLNKNLFSFIKVLTNKAGKLCYLEIKNDSDTIMILPVQLYKNKIVSQDLLDYYDCVCYSTLSKEQAINCFKAVTKLYNMPLEIKKLNESGFLYNLIKEDIECEKSVECTKINLPTTYEEYYNSLSKHSRQNLRTAYNRAKSDSVCFTTEMFNGKLDKRMAKGLQKIYIERRNSRYKRVTFLKRIYLKHFDSAAKACFGLDNSFTFNLKVKDEIVSYMSGFIKGKEILIPRLSINDKYSRYSIGIILVNEVVKKLIEMQFNCLDLAIGVETYKSQMGGVINNLYNVIFEV